MVIILQLVRRQIIGLLQIRRYAVTKVKVVKSKDVKTRQQTQYKGIVHFHKQNKHATLPTIIEHNKHYCQKKSSTTCLQSKLNDVIISSALLSNSKGLFHVVILNYCLSSVNIKSRVSYTLIFVHVVRAGVRG